VKRVAENRWPAVRPSVQVPDRSSSAGRERTDPEHRADFDERPVRLPQYCRRRPESREHRTATPAPAAPLIVQSPIGASDSPAPVCALRQSPRAAAPPRRPRTAAWRRHPAGSLVRVPVSRATCLDCVTLPSIPPSVLQQPVVGSPRCRGRHAQRDVPAVRRLVIHRHERLASYASTWSNEFVPPSRTVF